MSDFTRLIEELEAAQSELDGSGKEHGWLTMTPEDVEVMRAAADRLALEPTVIRDRRPTWEETEEVEAAGGALLYSRGPMLDVAIIRRLPEGAVELHISEWFWIADGAPDVGAIWRPLNPDGSGMRLRGKG